MKKLKLTFVNAKDVELLSREQLKEITGGSGSGGPLTKCLTGPCTLSVQGSNGQWVTRDGNCASHVDTSGPFGIPNVTCYCSTGLGQVPLSSNGGVSRCTQ